MIVVGHQVQIDERLAQMGHPSNFVGGYRVTDAWPCAQQWSPLASRACRYALSSSCFQGSERHADCMSIWSTGHQGYGRAAPKLGSAHRQS